MVRKLLFLTGTRADFGKLKRLMQSVAALPDEFECHIFATGMHTIARYGSTFDEIRKVGFENLFPYINQIADHSGAMDIVLASTIQGLGHYVRELRPDMIVVHGDRIETLAGAIVGALNNILVAHIEGGELSGTIDELIRHAVSKLAHLHFVANEEARQRLIQMGEDRRSIFPIGSPDVDVMLSDSLPTLDEVKSRYGIPFAGFGIFCYHPVTTELDVLPKHIDEVMAAIRESNRNFVVIYPNNDAGSEIILSRIGQLTGDRRFRVFPSMRFEYFLSLLKHSEVIVGNSSAGIREAPVYGVPTINIGTRQLNRFRHPSIANVREDRHEIMTALTEHVLVKTEPSLYFGEGRSAERFIEILRTDIWNTPRQKQFRDLEMMAAVQSTMSGGS